VTWAELFDRADDCEATVDDVREVLAEHRERADE